MRTTGLSTSASAQPELGDLLRAFPGRSVRPFRIVTRNHGRWEDKAAVVHRLQKRLSKTRYPLEEIRKKCYRTYSQKRWHSYSSLPKTFLSYDILCNALRRILLLGSRGLNSESEILSDIRRRYIPHEANGLQAQLEVQQKGGRQNGFSYFFVT